MSSCLSGGGRAYRLESLDLEIIKSPSSNSWISNSSSPSSTLSESSNCPLRKPRTPRKRPNQIYNEAAAILSTAYPKIFPSKHLTKPAARKFTRPHDHSKSQLIYEHSDLLMPFQIVDNSGFLMDPPLLQRPTSLPEPKGFNFTPCQSPGEINSSEICSGECQEEGEADFDAESILDEEIGEGIDSIMGDLGMENESVEDCNTNYSSSNTQINNGFCYGYPVGLGFQFEYGMRREMRAIRNGDEGDWWRFPSVNVRDITPNIARTPPEKKKKKKNKVEKGVEITNSEGPNSISTGKQNSDIKSPGEESVCVPQPNAGLLLKLNYDSVLNEWSDKAAPIPGDSPASQSAGNDVQARLAQIELFTENGGIREASVLRYKEKRRTRLFSKKIRYQVRKLNADRRPRMKGRFVRTPNSSDD